MSSTPSANDGLPMSNDSLCQNCSERHRENPNISVLLIYIPTVFYVIIFVTGIVGNALVVAAVFKMRRMRTSTNFLLANLSIADILVLLVCMPTALMDLLTSDIWYLGKFMCYLVPFLEQGVTNTSVLTILAISTERYIVICKPLIAQSTCTFRRVLKVLGAVWFIALAGASPFLALTQFKDSIQVNGMHIKSCKSYIRENWHKLYILGMSVVFYLIPLIIICVIYGIITKTLLFSHELVATDSQQAKSRRRVVRMLFVIVTLYFLCHLPIKTLSALAILNQSQTRKLGIETYYSIIYFCRIMFYLNSCVNPFIYGFMSTKFRSAFSDLMPCRSHNEDAISQASTRSRRSTSYTPVSFNTFSA